MKIPNRITIIDGRLKMADGSSLRAYLKAWQTNNKLKDGTPVNVSSHDYQQRIESDADLGRNWGS